MKKTILVVNKIAHASTLLALPLAIWVIFGTNEMRVIGAMGVVAGMIGSLWLFNRVRNESTFEPLIEYVSQVKPTAFGVGFILLGVMPLVFTDLMWMIYIPVVVLYSVFLSEEDTLPLNAFFRLVGIKVHNITYLTPDGLRKGLVIGKEAPELHNKESKSFYSGEGRVFTKVR